MFTKKMIAFVTATLLTFSALAATDPAGDAGGSQGDIVNLEASGKQDRLSVTLQTAESYGFVGTQLLIDTDLNAKTGHAFGSIGADILIENDRVYEFSGDDSTAWAWKDNGPVRRTIEDNLLTLGVKGKTLGSSRIALIARTLDESFNQLDRAPDKSAILVAFAPQRAQPDEDADAPAEKAGDCKEPSGDLVAVLVKQDESVAELIISTAKASDFVTTLIFFDTDQDEETGFQPAGEEAFGFEFMASGNELLKHKGEKRTDWKWEKVDGLERKVVENTLTVRLGASQLQSESVGVVVWTMSADWQARLDQAPDSGQYPLVIDPDMFTPAKPKEEIKLAPRKSNADLPARERVAQSTSFYCYYSKGHVAELSHYDVAVLHSPQFIKEDIAKLKQLGVVTIGYITVGEDDVKRKGDGTGPAGLASWYFDRDKDSQPDKNSIWNSWYANANDPNWRADRVKEAKRLVEEEGYDGIFLDTLDTAQLYPDTEDGMVQLVADLRDALPNSPIVLNQGFLLFHRLAPMADALMLESFTATYDFYEKEYKLNSPASLDAHTRNVQRNLEPVLKEHPMPIFVLDYARPSDTEAIQIAADRAATFGYQFASAPIYLDEVYVNDIVGKPDPKWLEIQATPESLSIILAEASNGFPAGTTLQPSSCYAGYSVAPLVDGIKDRSELHWTRAAWASSENDSAETYLRMILPKAQAGGSLKIRWATDSGVTHVSKDFTVQVRADNESAWQASTDVVKSRKDTVEVGLPQITFSEIRIIQKVGGGSESRPDLMWIAQLVLEEE